MVDCIPSGDFNYKELNGKTGLRLTVFPMEIATLPRLELLDLSSNQVKTTGQANIPHPPAFSEGRVADLQGWGVILRVGG